MRRGASLDEGQDLPSLGRVLSQLRDEARSRQPPLTPLPLIIP